MTEKLKEATSPVSLVAKSTSEEVSNPQDPHEVDSSVPSDPIEPVQLNSAAISNPPSQPLESNSGAVSNPPQPVASNPPAASDPPRARKESNQRSSNFKRNSIFAFTGACVLAGLYFASQHFKGLPSIPSTPLL